MALKVKAVERLLKFTNDENDHGVYRYVLKPELYTSLDQKKVEVIKAWATEGHAVALPGLGSMRFGLRSKSVEKVEDVKTGLITSRRIIFTPSVDLKDELANTGILITCYDRDGKEVKRVTSTSGEVEDPENGSTENGSTENGGSTSGGSGIVPGPSGNDQPSGN